MLFFDARDLFTNIPLEYTIDLVLKQIHENHDILVSVTKNGLGKILTRHEKPHFLFPNVLQRLSFQKNQTGM